MSCEIVYEFVDPQGRFIVTEITIDNTEIVLCNVYAPNVDSPEFIQNVKNVIQQRDNRNIILGGDFNFVMNNDLDRLFSHCNNDKAKDEMINFMSEFELTECWRALNPGKKQYSCCRPNSDDHNWYKFSRLDMFFISDGLFNAVSKCVMQPGFQSDHSFVILDVDLVGNKRGSGYWKFNLSHLRDKEYLLAAKSILCEKANEQMPPNMKWEMMKGALIEFSKKYGKDKAQDKKRRMQEIEERLDRLFRILHLPECHNDSVVLYRNLDKERQELLKQKVAGIQLRSKEQYYAEGERSSKYFFSLEKHNARKKVIARIRNQHGLITSKQGEIIENQAKFYSQLYASEKEISFQLKNQTGHQISEHESKMLDMPLTMEELAGAVKELPNNKSPGPDGLPIEIYKIFWEILGPIYFEAILYARKNGQLYVSARRGIITLLPKKDRDLLEIANWRPITLLNSDYKILAKALARRLQPVLQNLIHADQTGFMKNRNIQDNIRKIIEVCEYMYIVKKPAIIMNIDYRKCFDMLEHSAIWGSLKYYGFGEEFIEWVKLLYRDVELSIINNGHLSRQIQVSRSVLQGSPIAAFLFLIVGQILHDQIVNNKDIKGVSIHEIELLISQFADDTTLFLTYESLVVQAVIQTFDNVYANTGLIVNYDKTNIYRIGSLAGSMAKLYTAKEFNWTNEPIKTLGVTIPIIPDNKLVSVTNFETVFCTVDKITKQWSLRNLSLMGRILIVNTLIMSLFVYK